HVDRFAEAVGRAVLVHDVLVAHELAAVHPAEAVLVAHLAVGEGALPAVADEIAERLVGGGRGGARAAGCQNSEDGEREGRGGGGGGAGRGGASSAFLSARGGGTGARRPGGRRLAQQTLEVGAQLAHRAVEGADVAVGARLHDAALHAGEHVGGQLAPL